jgi:hypothetical protein
VFTEVEEVGKITSRSTTPEIRTRRSPVARRRMPRGELERESERTENGKECLASGSGEGRVFKKVSWAHRTVYSACPVYTGQRTVVVR